MTKRQFVELIQDRLSGGDMPDDMKGKMHPRVIEEWLGLALIFRVPFRRPCLRERPRHPSAAGRRASLSARG